MRSTVRGIIGRLVGGYRQRGGGDGIVSEGEVMVARSVYK